jgi:adenylate kinase family enzyme
MTKTEKNTLLQQIEARLDERLGKNNEKLELFVESTSGRYLGIALERLDDNFKIIAENFQTVNARFDRLISILEKKQVIEEGLF